MIFDFKKSLNVGGVEGESAVGQSNAGNPGGFVTGSPGGSQVSGGKAGRDIGNQGSLGQGGNADFYGGGGTSFLYNVF